MTNSEYASLRAMLIPKAMADAQAMAAMTGKVAEVRIGAVDPITKVKSKYNHSFVTEYFHQNMDKMAREAGLIRGHEAVL